MSAQPIDNPPDNGADTAEAIAAFRITNPECFGDGPCEHSHTGRHIVDIFGPRHCRRCHRYLMTPVPAHDASLAPQLGSVGASDGMCGSVAHVPKMDGERTDEQRTDG